MKYCISLFPWACLIAMLFIPSFGWTADFNDPAREGVTHYNREEFDPATAKFQASLAEEPDNPEVAYNLANSQYRLGRYEEAVGSFKKALTNSTPPDLRQKILLQHG